MSDDTPLPLRPKIVTCLHCGVERTVHADGPPPKYCSAKCRTSAAYLRARRDGRYQALQDRLKEQRAALRPCCANCGGLTRSVRSKYCMAAACRELEKTELAERRRVAFRETYRADPERERSRVAKFRAGMTAAQVEEQRRAIRAYRVASGRSESARFYDHKRRAVIYGTRVELFSRREIFRRDDWTCGICGSAVDPSLKYPDPMSVSLDHVVPISRGGEHTRDNARCAHLSCNMAKGVRLDEELA